ncbi:hypothetical protein M2267_005671 [Ensifer sp. KUDG1]|uniref:hypothetical protein n=1 Tax=Ensifer sp. KUDG1 TaxID=3373919 RepID=UPI003D212A73
MYRQERIIDWHCMDCAVSRGAVLCLLEMFDARAKVDQALERKRQNHVEGRF